ncbi:hypothetical protein VPH35_005934 [Triticum aestivum]
MSSCRRGPSGYRGARLRPSDAYYAEIRPGGVRLGLGTFETAHEAVPAYDVAAWHLGRPHVQLNYHDVYTGEQAQRVAPPPRLITDQDREDHRRWQRRLLIAERAMAEWRRRHPEDVAAKNAFWAERTASRRTEHADRRRRKALAISQCDIIEAGETSIFSPDDDHWDEMWLDTSDNTTEDDDDDDEDDWE